MRSKEAIEALRAETEGMEKRILRIEKELEALKAEKAAGETAGAGDTAAGTAGKPKRGGKK